MANEYKQEIFPLGDLVYVRNYGQGPKWIKGTIVDYTRPYNFLLKLQYKIN